MKNPLKFNFIKNRPIYIFLVHPPLSLYACVYMSLHVMDVIVFLLPGMVLAYILASGHITFQDDSCYLVKECVSPSKLF